MTRRHILQLAAAALAHGDESTKIAITMDDVNWKAIPDAHRERANDSILSALRDCGDLKAVLFVCGANVDNDAGRRILQSWNEAGHMLANHTYSHRLYSSTSFEDFSADVLRCEQLIGGYSQFHKFLRFPALKEGDTAEKRDRMREFVSDHGYRNGHVTIDASDWYYDSRLRQKLGQEPGFDIQHYRRPYLGHLWDRAAYYDNLSQKVLGRSAAHTLLIHYNLLNAVFLKDVLTMFRERGWKWIDAKEAFADPVFQRAPQTLPAGESLIWALAKETGRFDRQLRYPGEDEEYEKPRLDEQGL